MLFDETYRPVLSIPINDCQRFSARPLSWLRYVASTIYGGEGDISTCPDGGPVVDYNRAGIESGIYYYITESVLFPGLFTFLPQLTFALSILFNQSTNGSQMTRRVYSILI